MDLMAAIGFLGTLITFEEAGKSWLQIVKEKIKNKEIDINKWDSNDPIVQRCLDRFKTDMRGQYRDYIFSTEEVNEIISDFFNQNKNLPINYKEKQELSSIIRNIFHAYNDYTKSQMSSGERTLHNEISVTKEKLMDKLDWIEKQPRRENIQRFLRSVENSKEIELENIEECINGEYEIDRSELLKTIQLEGERLISIQGNAGSGKSVICKKILKDKEYVLATRAENLSTVKSINELWNCDLEDACQWLDSKLLYIFVDAIEFIADCGNNAFLILQELYRFAEKNKNVRVITSCRNADSSAFIKVNSKYRIKSYEVMDLSKSEVDKIAIKYPVIFELQKSKKYSDLLISPFYINLIISGGFEIEKIDEETNFRNLIWEKIICLKDKCKKYNVLQSDLRDSIQKIVFERAKTFSVGVDSDIVGSDILEALRSEGIIVESVGKIRLKYDIFEDICFERYIDKAFESCRGEYNNFFSEIEKLGRCIYRRYQIWISSKLLLQNSREKFIYNLLIGAELDVNWRKQTEIGIVKSKYCGLFFDEFYWLLNDVLLIELMDITNLYAFEAKISHDPLFMEMAPIGAAREYLIKLASDGKIDLVHNREKVIKLCDDYSNSDNKTIEVEKKACKIIIQFVEELMQDATDEKSFYKYDDEIARLFLITIKMTRASKEWVTKFIEDRINEYNSGASRRESVSEIILEAVVKKCTVSLAMELPELTCKSAETLWSKRKIKGHFPYGGHDLDNLADYGLSDNAGHHMNHENGVYNNVFIWLVMRCNFKIGFEWAIAFINKTVKAYAETDPELFDQIDIYFSEKKMKSYLGNEYLWLGDQIEHSLPVVLTDIIYVIKKTLINTIKNSTDIVFARALSEYVRKTLYEKSNNVLLLSIIESIGMNFQRELPGYALELASSMELIYYDIHRSSEYIIDPTKKLLENQIMIAVGVPDIPVRYEKDSKCACNLQQYFSKEYLTGDDKVKSRCHLILDYLYSKFDEAEYPNENLQIQKMDFRNPIITEVDDKTLAIEPQIEGAAKRILDDNKAANTPIVQLDELLKNLLESIDTKRASADQVIAGIEKLCEMMKTDDRIEVKYEDVLVLLIASALRLSDIKVEQQEKIVEEWLNRIEKIFLNQSFAVKFGLEIALWEQLNKDINVELKNRILLIMLKSIFDVEHSGLVSKLSEHVVPFLTRNRSYAKRMFNTIIMLAADEMKHQKFNSAYIKEKHPEEFFEFVPNMTPKLRGVDYWIDEEKGELFKSEEKEIIEDYLYNSKDIDFTEFDVKNYDIKILCNIGKCGLDIQDERFGVVLKSIINCLIQLWNNREVRVHEIIDVYDEHKLTSYFERELGVIDSDPEPIYEILFDEIDYSKFTMDTVHFYEDIFGFFLSAYVDGFRVEGKRTDLERKIRILETYISNIQADFAKNELEKRLFLCAGRFARWDTNKIKTEYSFKDKLFLNTQISKYGYKHLKDVIRTIYLLKIDELLPEILVSIGVCFENSIENNKKEFAKDIKESQTVVEMLVLKAFSNYGDEIKKDASLIKAYETILISLIEIRNEKAAVLLDEFRIH